MQIPSLTSNYFPQPLFIDMPNIDWIDWIHCIHWFTLEITYWKKKFRKKCMEMYKRLQLLHFINAGGNGKHYRGITKHYICSIAVLQHIKIWIANILLMSGALNRLNYALVHRIFLGVSMSFSEFFSI